MKRLITVISVPLLLGALVGVTCFAGVLYKEDFSEGFNGYGGKVFSYGSGPNSNGFIVKDGELDGGNGDGAQEAFLVLTGDPSWRDVAIQAKMRINGQTTGVAKFIVRAKDDKNYYEFRYTTGRSRVMPDEEASGITSPAGNPNLRIMKVINGKWEILAETDDPGIPAIQANGELAGQSITFRFEAKGDKLIGYIDDGSGMKKWLEAIDSGLAEGMVGLGQYDYAPIWDDLQVESF